MTKHVKPSRLFICRWFAAFALGGLALNVFAADVPIPRPSGGSVSQNSNYLEYKKTGNTYTWNPVGTSTPPGSGSISFPATQTVSTVEPKFTATGDLPYQHKGGAGAKVSISIGINKQALAKAASDAVKGAASIAAAGSTNPYVQVGALACVVFCAPLAEWGINQLKKNSDGTFSAIVPDTDFESSTSDGNEYSTDNVNYYPDKISACNAAAKSYASRERYPPYRGGYGSISARGGCNYHFEVFRPPYNDWVPGGLSDGATFYDRPSSSCPAGSPIVNGVCNGPAPTVEKPLDRIFEDNIVNKPWETKFAEIAAQAIASGIYKIGENIYTDGTSLDITGPNAVPISETTSTWPVNVLPGTTTPAPSGHTGPTDSGTLKQTTTTTAENTFNPSSSGSGGSSASGPSMTTTQKSETKSSVTNNITNNTSTTVTTNITQTDEPPKEEEKDFCQKNPDALACAEADTPEQETPKGELNISYEYVDIFGNGSCPSDSYLNTHGQSLKVWDWAATCDNVQSYFRPILIACCAFAAFVIVSAGAKE